MRVAMMIETGPEKEGDDGTKQTVWNRRAHQCIRPNKCNSRYQACLQAGWALKNLGISSAAARTHAPPGQVPPNRIPRASSCPIIKPKVSPSSRRISRMVCKFYLGFKWFLHTEDISSTSTGKRTPRTAQTGLDTISVRVGACRSLPSFSSPQTFSCRPTCPSPFLACGQTHSIAVRYVIFLSSCYHGVRPRVINKTWDTILL